MRPTFLLFTLLTLGGALAAVVLPRLIHSALCLAVSFVGLALLFLGLGAQFVGLAQVLVYVGAVAILILFTILLTRGGDRDDDRRWSPAPAAGLAVAGLVFLTLAGVILASAVTRDPPWPAAGVSTVATVAEIGRRLMTDYVLPLELVGLLLTAALLGAVVIALRDPASPPPGPGEEPGA